MQAETSSSPRAALRLALPGMLAMIASSLCALTDALLLGRQSMQSSAAAAACLPILTLIQTLGFTLGTGAGSHLSRCIGSGDRASGVRAAQFSFWLSLLLSVPLCGAGLLFRAPLLSLLGAGGASLPESVTYAGFLLITGPLLCASLVLGSLLRGAGRMGAYTIACVLGAAAGVLLQLLLIGHMGVTGSGIAMLAREALTLFILLAAAYHAKPHIFPSLRSLSADMQALRDIMRSGLPVLVRQGLSSVSAAVFTRVSSAFGGAALAGMGIAARAVMIVSSAVIGFSQGFQPLIGYAAGQEDQNSARKIARALLVYVVVSMIGLGAAAYAFAPRMLSFFHLDEDVFGVAVRSLRAQSAAFFAQGAVIAMTTLTQALGMTARGSIVAASRQGFILIPLLLILPRLWGLSGLILCQSVSDVLSLLLCLVLTLPVLTYSSCGPCGCSDARTASR